ncbi:MAG: hypothetical protein L3J39_07750 [Verrucomicrobiales bacterium]|nr:hypothetical protein [Verrucomicrobiales bacterium]
MKSGSLLLLAAVLVVVVLNLLATLGVFGGGDSSSDAALWEYKVMSPAEMDAVGYKAVAADEGIEADEDGKMTLPREKVVIQSIMPRTLVEVQKEGWELLTVQATQGGNFFIFRRPQQ